tara:strand:- start:271 stop:582 length:312 start_codon:yes stop_codon:yes gene_type:complete
MSLIGNIDNIPLFTTIAEAELWGSQYGINGHHTHVLLGQLGYMAGTTHADITAANLNVVTNPLTPSQVRQASGSPTPTVSVTMSSGGSGGSSGGSSSGGGGGY